MMIGRKRQRLRSGAAGGETLFMEEFGVPLFAYSVRKLRGTYTGSCMRVRRSSDDAEQDIGFSDGDLDTTELLAFVGANNGYVVTWYDQSGNGNHATTPSAAVQPRIVLSGVVTTDAGIPALRAQSTQITLDTGLVSLTEKTTVCCSNTTTPSGEAASRIVTSYAGSGAVSSEVLHDYLNGTGYRYFDGGKTVTRAGSRGRSVTASYRTATEIGLSVNGGAYGVASSPTGANTNTLKLFEEGGSVTDELPTYISEVIMFDTDKTGVLSDMVANVNTYYGVY